MILVSGDIRCVGILAGVPLGGAPNESGVVDAGIIFGDLSGYFFGSFRYANPCRPVTDCKTNDLE